MIYLTGVTNDRDEPALIDAGVGLMCQPGNSYHLRIERYRFWAADNGCFSDRWVEDQWMDWLANLAGRGECLFAVAPDVYPDAAATLERSRPYFPIIRELGFPVALVAQDHAERLQLPWEDFDVLFIGGEAKPGGREWKLSDAAAGLVAEARRHGKWVHMGRVNSIKRMRQARLMGCHSADGTFIKYRRRRRVSDFDENDRDGRGANEIADWASDLATQPIMPFLANRESPSLEVHRRHSMGTTPPA